MSSENNESTLQVNNEINQPNNEAQYQPTKFEVFLSYAKSLIIRGVIIYFITSFFRRPTPVTNPSVPGSPDTSTGSQMTWNLFPNGTVYDLYVYIAEEEQFNDFSNNDKLFWYQPGLIYGDWYSGENGDGSYTFSNKFLVSESLQNNGSIYLHAYAVRSGKTLDPQSPGSYAGEVKSYVRKQLNRYKKQRYLKTKNLLTGEMDRSAEEKEKIKKGLKEEIVSHWHPNLTLNIVTDQTNWMKGSVPPPLDEYIEFIPGTNKYKPVLFPNDFWNMLRDYHPINSSVNELELCLTLQPLSLFKWQLYSAQASRNKWVSGMFGESFTAAEEDDADQDALRETLLETSPYLLFATIVVSILHSIFELLAFKNDIQFWNNRESLEGLSVRSVFFNVFQSLIVLLFVLDNETNMIIRISCGVGLCIEIWKIKKVVNVSVDTNNKLFGILPRIVIADKGSYVESSTKQYDTMAFKYLSWICFPLLAGYAGYSLIYLEHKGWYSFILNMLYGFLLTFGFIMMTPQLFINYKLKSVAHLPWRMMTYKFLNTFIDDIFAFVIKMPTMYRLGCFRDDIVFIIFLYQRWIYKVDEKRLNEFGFSAEMEQKAKMQITTVNESEETILEKKEN